MTVNEVQGVAHAAMWIALSGAVIAPLVGYTLKLARRRTRVINEVREPSRLCPACQTRYRGAGAICEVCEDEVLQDGAHSGTSGWYVLDVDNKGARTLAEPMRFPSREMAERMLANASHVPQRFVSYWDGRTWAL